MKLGGLMHTPEVKKVLSIDMDYIMEPCINLYNDLCGGEDDSFNIWARVQEARDIERHLSINEENLLTINNVFTKNILNIKKENILFAENHDAILNLLCEGIPESQKYDIWNIDHHHDIYYNDESKHHVEKFNFTAMADWVWYLKSNNLLNNYTWVRNQNSAPFYDIGNGFVFQEVSSHNISKIMNLEYDYLFICKSPHWFPDKFHHYFEMLKNTASNLKSAVFETAKGGYCIDGKSRPLAR